MAKNIEIQINTGNNSYEVLYPKIELTNNNGILLGLNSGGTGVNSLSGLVNLLHDSFAHSVLGTRKGDGLTSYSINLNFKPLIFYISGSSSGFSATYTVNNGNTTTIRQDGAFESTTASGMSMFGLINRTSENTIVFNRPKESFQMVWFQRLDNQLHVEAGQDANEVTICNKNNATYYYMIVGN